MNTHATGFHVNMSLVKFIDFDETWNGATQNWKSLLLAFVNSFYSASP
jgi:hypothetical protein